MGCSQTREHSCDSLSKARISRYPRARENDIVSMFHGNKKVVEHLFHICSDHNGFLPEAEQDPKEAFVERRSLQ